MQLIQDAVERCQDPGLDRGCVITIGNFDGVHTGHRALIREANAMAQRLDCPLVILTFWPHTAQEVPGRSVRRIYAERQKTELLQEAAPHAVILEFAFDEALRTMPEERFFREILLERYRCRGLVVGRNFRYGHLGRGSAETLEAHCRANGLCFQALDGVMAADASGDARIVSSTWIRELLAQSRIEKANELLTRPYFVEGIVQHGKRLGRTIGFPTVNLILPGELTEPGHGVYVSRVQTPYGLYFGVSNVGVNPTVEHGHRIKVETHLLDFAEDLYDKPIRVELLHFLRAEHRFADVTALQAQLKLDTDNARRLIEGGRI